MPRWFNLPNLFTSLRLALVPFVVQAILSGRTVAALALFAAAAATDVLDGAAARRLGLTTQMGAYLDPIADKCLLSGVFLALAMAGIAPWWFVAVIFGRDLYILLGVGGFMLFTRIREFPPSVWGKVSTFVQILTAIFLMANARSPAILWLCVVFTAWSGIHYTWRGLQIARSH